jgi:hypothetical protein
LIQKEVKLLLANEILFGKLENGGTVEIDLGENELVFKYEPALSDQPSAISLESDKKREEVKNVEVGAGS